MRLFSWRRIKMVGVALGVLTVGAGAFAVYEAPALGAYSCPSCYGFEKVAENLYTDDVGAAETLGDMRSEARARVAAFYGTLGDDAPLFICTTPECDRRMGFRGAKAMAYGASSILVFSPGTSVDFLAHEMAHIELVHRVGAVRAFRNAVPAWFNEGLASLISEDPRYVRIENGERSCTVEPDGAPLPATFSEWGPEAGRQERPLYAMAACAVLRWMDENGGEAGVLAALDAVAAGEAVAFGASP